MNTRKSQLLIAALHLNCTRYLSISELSAS